MRVETLKQKYCAPFKVVRRIQKIECVHKEKMEAKEAGKRKSIYTNKRHKEAVHAWALAMKQALETA